MPRLRSPNWGWMVAAGPIRALLPGTQSVHQDCILGRKKEQKRGEGHLGRCCASRKCARMKREKVRPSWLRNRTQGQAKEGGCPAPSPSGPQLWPAFLALPVLPPPKWKSENNKNCAKKKTNSCQITKPLPLLQELVTYLCFIVNVPSERNGIISDLLNVADGVEAFFVVSWVRDERQKLWFPVSNVRL